MWGCEGVSVGLGALSGWSTGVVVLSAYMYSALRVNPILDVSACNFGCDRTFFKKKIIGRTGSSRSIDL